LFFKNVPLTLTLYINCS